MPLTDGGIGTDNAPARRVGLSRTEYVRRTLERERAGSTGPVVLEDLQRVASLASDLESPDVMTDAWS